MTVLEKLQAWVGLDAAAYTEAQLNLFLDAAQAYILNYCRRSDFPPALELVQVQLAAISCNRAGAEGVQSQSEGSVSISYMPADADIPASLLDQLNTYRKVGIPGADATT